MSIKKVVLALGAVVIVAGATRVMSSSEFDRTGPDRQAGQAPVVGTVESVSTHNQGMDSFNPSNVIVVGSESVSDRVSVGGSVVPVRTVTLTAQIPGSVRFIAGRAGTTAKVNQVLVAINREQILAQRRAAVAEWQRAQSQLANAQMQYQRQLYLARNGRSRQDMGGFLPFGMDRMANGMMGGGPSGIERRAEVFDSQTHIAEAQNAIRTAVSRIEEMDAAIADSDSRAPFAGVVVQKLVEVGDTVQPGQSLLVYADLSRLQVEVDVPAGLMHGLATGQPVEIDLDMADGPAMARVAQIFPMADRIRHTVRVKLDLPAGVPATPGMYAEVLVPGAQDRVVKRYPVVPESALTYRGGLPMLFVIADGGEPRLRLVRIGDKTQSGVAVTSGLKEGERVLVDTVRYSAN